LVSLYPVITAITAVILVILVFGVRYGQNHGKVVDSRTTTQLVGKLPHDYRHRVVVSMTTTRPTRVFLIWITVTSDERKSLL